MKKGTNSEVSFVETILHSWQFIKEREGKGKPCIHNSFLKAAPMT